MRLDCVLEGVLAQFNQFMFKIDRVAIAAAGQRLEIGGDARVQGVKPGGILTGNGGLQFLPKRRREVDALVVGRLGVCNVRSEGIVSCHSGIQHSLRPQITWLVEQGINHVINSVAPQSSRDASR